MKPKNAPRLAWTIGIVSIASMLAALALMFVDRHVAMPDNQTASGGSWTFGNVLNDVVNIAATAFGILLAAGVRAIPSDGCSWPPDSRSASPPSARRTRCTLWWPTPARCRRAERPRGSPTAWA